MCVHAIRNLPTTIKMISVTILCSKRESIEKSQKLAMAQAAKYQVESLDRSRREDKVCHNVYYICLLNLPNH